MDVERPLLDLTPTQCYKLLRAGSQVGRLCIVHGGYPIAVPVNYALDGDAIVIRSRPGAKLEAAYRSRVAFQVDHLNPDTRSGWSVLIRGTAREITPATPETYERIAAIALSPWVERSTEHFLRIEPVLITGKLLGRLSDAREARGARNAADAA